MQADLLLADFGDAMLLDVDRFAAASSASELQAFVFSEDVQVEDATAAFARMSLHGAAALVLLGAIDATAAALSSDLRCVALQVAGHPVHAARRDQAGVPGVELFMPTEVVARVFDAPACGWFRA